jgi:DNA-binding IclR family transcriptional regulator
MHSNVRAYQLAQEGVTRLKTAILILLERSGPQGLSNAEIGRALGIYRGHVGHEGHVPRTLLELLQSEELVIQDKATKRWTPVRASGGVA